MTLQALTLSAFTTPENSVAPAVIGSVQGISPGSSLSLTDDAGGRFALSGTNIIRGATALDYETSTVHSITLTETLAGATNTPNPSDIQINVTNVVDGPSLSALGGTFSLAESAAPGTFAGSITGKTSGSTLSLVDDAAGRVALSGTGIIMGAVPLDYETATSHSFTVRETLADSPNSPRDTVRTLNVTDITEGGGSGTIATPVILVDENLPGDSPPFWTIDFVEPYPDGADYGDTIRCRYGLSEAAMLAATPVEEVMDDELIPDENDVYPALFPEVDTWAAAQSVGSTLWWQVMVYRDGSNQSDWSDPATFAIVDGTPNVVAFTDKTGQVASTVIWSDPIVIAGLASGAYARFTVEAGGLLRVNGGASIDSTGEAVVQNGDTLAVALTSSATSGAVESRQVFQRGVLYDTFSVTTVGAALTPPAGSVLYLDASDLATLFQSIAGTGAVAADGDVVGYWGDKSGGAKHLTAVADNTTRPAFKIESGKQFIRFDGVNDFLRVLNSLGTYAAGAATIGLAMRYASPATARALVSYGSTSNTNNIYNLVQTESGTASRSSVRINSSTGTVIAANTLDVASGAFDGTPKTLIVTDSGSSLIGYLDNVAAVDGPQAYTRTGSMTNNIMGIGGFARATPVSFAAVDIFALVIYNSVLNSTDRGTLHAFLDSKLP